MDKIPYDPSNLEHRDSSKYRLTKGDVFTHTVNALNSSKKDLSLRWALLFHDLGKKETHTVTDTGRIMHPGHSKHSIKKAEAIMRKYKFDSKTMDDVLWLISKHDVFMNWDEMKKSKKMKLVANPLIDTLIDHYEADRRSTNAPEHLERAMKNIKKYRDEIDVFKQAVDKFEQVKKFDLVTGKDLHDFGLPQGPVFGEILNHVRDKYLEGELSTREEILEYIKSKYIKKEEIKTKEGSLLKFLNEN